MLWLEAFALSAQVDMPQNLVLIKGGTFQMGCTPEQDENCLDRSKPVHEVTLSDYYLAKYPVTNKEFVAFLNEATNQVEGGKPWLNLDKSLIFRVLGNYKVLVDTFLSYPVKGVTWYGARAYAEWLSVQTGINYRLPTEAEWEFAARGGNLSKGYMYSGSNDRDEIAKRQKYFNGYTVGQYQPNELGLYDMSGNIQQWCSDWYQTPYPEQAQDNPIGPDEENSEKLKVVRGFLRVSRRFARHPIMPLGVTGFRLAASSAQ